MAGLIPSAKALGYFHLVRWRGRRPAQLWSKLNDPPFRV